MYIYIYGLICKYVSMYVCMYVCIEMGEKQKRVEILYKIIGPSLPSPIILHSPIQVQDLRKTIAENASLPVEKLRLILKGKALSDNKNGVEESIQLKDGDSLIVAVKPKSPVKYDRDELSEDDDEEVLKFQVSQLKSGWQRTLFLFLRHKLRIPEVRLVAIFSISLKVWVIIALWFTLAPVAHKWDLGPVYILATGFAIIFLNLGKRQRGDISAYSIFNEDFRELPGTFNADRVDRDIRAGQI